MTTPASGGPRETGIWYRENGARKSDVPLVEGAVRNLGNLSMRVIDDPLEARDVVFAIFAERLSRLYLGNPNFSIPEMAQSVTDVYLRDMQVQETGPDPLRLIRVESADGSAVSADAISDEIRFRVKPALERAPITVDELLHTAAFPVDPQTLLS